MTEIAIGDRISASARWSHGRNKLHINNIAKCKFSSVIPRSWSPKSWIQFLSFHYRHPSDRIELHNLLLFTDQHVRKFRNIWLKMDRNSQKLTFEDSINSLQKHMSYNFSLVVKTHSTSSFLNDPCKRRKLKTHQPLWSIHWRRSSMGGWAPYFSKAGMLKSSTKITHCFPFWGPKIPGFLLNSFPSIMSWVWFALVWAEKLKKMDCQLQYELNEVYWQAEIKFIHFVHSICVSTQL